MKQCKKCGKMKPATEEYFCNYSKSVDKLFYYCKDCQKEINFKNTQKYKTLNKYPVIDKWYRKTCSKCKQKKHYTEFNININNSDGLYDYCKRCQKKFEKQCKHCGSFKDLSEFNHYKNGYYRYCKECQKEINNNKRIEKKLKTHKFCSNCGKLKEFSKFYQNRTTEDGFHHECKDCCMTILPPTNKSYRLKKELSHYVNYWSESIGSI